MYVSSILEICKNCIISMALFMLFHFDFSSEDNAFGVERACII